MKMYAGFPASGRIREKFFFWKVREFHWESGKVGELCSDWGEPDFNPDSNALFPQTRCLPGFFRLAALGIFKKSIYLKVREKPCWKVRELFQSWLLGTLCMAQYMNAKQLAINSWLNSIFVPIWTRLALNVIILVSSAPWGLCQMHVFHVCLCQPIPLQYVKHDHKTLFTVSY